MHFKTRMDTKKPTLSIKDVHEREIWDCVFKKQFHQLGQSSKESIEAADEAIEKRRVRLDKLNKEEREAVKDHIYSDFDLSLIRTVLEVLYEETDADDMFGKTFESDIVRFVPTDDLIRLVRNYRKDAFSSERPDKMIARVISERKLDFYLRRVVRKKRGYLFTDQEVNRLIEEIDGGLIV